MRMTKVALVALLLLTTPAMARGSFHATPLPYSCEQVRGAVATFTIPHLRQMAKALHITITPAQMREAQKCLTHE